MSECQILNLLLFQFERENCVGKVSRSLPLGGEIITLSALDFDAGNMVTYRIVSGNADAWFYLDENSGVLTAKKDMAMMAVKQKPEHPELQTKELRVVDPLRDDGVWVIIDDACNS